MATEEEAPKNNSTEDINNSPPNDATSGDSVAPSAPAPLPPYHEIKYDTNAPPRRGRGRPPKPKPALPAGTILPPPRPRGRPPKARDPLAPPPPPKPVSAYSGSGRKRGRPPKAATAGVSQSPNKAAKTGLVQMPPGTAPRGRGRPPKVKPAVAAPVGA